MSRRLEASRDVRLGVGSVVAAAALLVGVRFTATFELPRPAPLLGLAPIPREDIGVSWSDGALWPAQLQGVAMERTAGLLLGLVGAAVLIAVLNAVIVLAEASAARRRELAVRAALGGTPATLLGLLLRELRILGLYGVAIGGGLGVLLGLSARALWPGIRLSLAPLSLAGGVAGALAGLAVAFAAAHTAPGWAISRSGTLARVLGAGERLTDDARAVFVRRALPAIQVAVGGALLVAVVALGSGVRGAGDVPDEASDTVVISAHAAERGDWSGLLARLAELPELEAETLSTRGALIGLGVQDIALAECGQCVRGTVIVPMLPARANHHAVAPGYFQAVGMTVSSGRPIAASDGPGAAPVAVVNRTFARSSFEDAQPLGKRIRVGGKLDGWYTVVGVVDDRTWPVPGSEERTREAVYLSALQHPPQSADVLLRGSPGAVAEARDVMVGLGLDPGATRSVAQVRSEAAAPLGWMRGVSFALAGLALVLTSVGIHATALQVTRRRHRELAVRRAIGARGRDVARHVLGERLRLTGWGIAGMIFLGTLGVAFVRKVAGGVRPPGPSTYVAVGGVVLVVALVASARAAAEGARVPPARAMQGP